MDGRAKRRVEAMRRVQAVALDLVEARGYDGVTVEDIAAAAEVGPATVYRNFGSKEGIFLWDDYDPLLFDALAARLGADRPLSEAVLAALIEALGQVYQGDQERILRRARLIFKVPALRAAAAGQGVELRQGLAALLTATGVAKGAIEADALAGAIGAAMQVAVEHWVQAEGKVPLRQPLRQAITALARFTATG